ncbi:autotransporter domain-containing protein [Citrobacter amalonaticus]|uniref:Lipase 1 n=1 Tax=Citrobacter amalonaticus TaxID=35703 RepID=A0A6N2TH16_CITAM|nr:autotransporter domain-containing protein [Citrobacter amalonaticus]HCB1822336.1 autotransporter domain-containing protein [Citrobacter amalonaticus]HCB1902079.1 autotransporter domain-containing protein [Citrobacter amalonaticus]HCB3265009.1 autotransporter domain-containing protein [Citrobacter amalonaticus]
MMIKKCSGRREIILLASVVLFSLYINTARAWQQEYIVDNTPGYTTERYTWDSDHQPRYDDILAERIRTTQTVPGLAVNLEQASPTEATSGMSMGWNFPVSGDITTGPVAALHYDGTTPAIYNEFGDSVVSQSPDPLWHASVSTLGWRVNSQFGDLRPWAQISYNQQFGENIWKAQSGLSRMTATTQDNNWLDVTVGADMLLNQHMAAYAALSQAENIANSTDYLYTMGVSARF